MKGKKTIMLLDNPFLPDNRVENEILALNKAGIDVDLYCVESNFLPEYEDLGRFKIYRQISTMLYRPFSKEYRDFVNRFSQNIAQMKPDIIHCHDFRMFFLGCRIKKLDPDIKLVYDSHEYLIGYPYFYRIKKTVSKFKGMFVWLWYVWLELNQLKEATALITVSDTLRNKLKNRSGKEVVLIRNIPPNNDLCQENCTYWHQTYGLRENAKVIVHTGNAHFSKKRLFYLLDVLKENENLAMVFLGSNTSVNEIKMLADQHQVKNIYFHEQVPRKYVPYYCSQANFGLVYTWNPFWRSYWYAMPNKLMDVSLAGIPVLATSQPELKRFVEEHKHGVNFNGNNKKHLEKAVEFALKNEVELRQNAQKIRLTVNWEKEQTKLINLYQSLFEK